MAICCARFLLFFLIIGGVIRAEPPVIPVGGYRFEPFVKIDAEGKASGLTLDLLQALNESQNDYRFVFVPTTAPGRYEDFQKGLFDVMFFENRDWGWKRYPVKSSRTFLEGGEVYIARNLLGRDQDFFASLKGKNIVGIQGYHYGFADFEELKEGAFKGFQIHLVQDSDQLLKDVLEGKADVGVITSSDLKNRISKQPELEKSLLVSKRYDQVYRHQAIVPENEVIGSETIDSLMEGLKESGRLQKLWEQYGLEEKTPVKTYVIGVENTQYYPYYDFSSTGERRPSFARELFDTFAKAKGYRFIYDSSPVKRLFLKLANGVVDFKYPDNPEWGRHYKRDKPIIYSQSTVKYIDGTMVLKLLKGKAKIKMLGTVMGFTPIPYREQIETGEVSVLENASFDGLIQQALLNRVDGIFANIDVVPVYLGERFEMQDSLVYDSSLPYVEGDYHLSTIRYPEIIEEFNTFLQEKAAMIAAMKQRYGIGGGKRE